MSLVPRRVAGSNPARGSKNQQAQILWHHYLLREPLLRRETRSLRPPPPGEVTCCLARIMGESHDSGRVPGLDRIIDDGISSGGSRTFGGKSRDPLSFSRSGLKTGDFLTSLFLRALSNVEIGVSRYRGRIFFSKEKAVFQRLRHFFDIVSSGFSWPRHRWRRVGTIVHMRFACPLVDRSQTTDGKVSGAPLNLR